MSPMSGGVSDPWARLAGEFLVDRGHVVEVADARLEDHVAHPSAASSDLAHERVGF